MAIKDQIFSFTLLNSEPERGWNFHWNMHQIYSHHLESFFNRISNILLFDPHIDSQVLHYGYIISQPPTDDLHVGRADFASVLKNYIHQEQDDDYYYVTNQELQTFVGGTDWNRVSSLVNDVAPIQFMVYIPPKMYSPLHIKYRDSEDKLRRNQYDSFLVPRFGGCTIYNPSIPSKNGSDFKKRKIEIPTDDLYATFNVIVSQMRALLGLRNDHNYGQGQESKGIHSVVVLMDESGLNDWELDILIRANILKDLEAVEVAMKTIYEMIDAVEQLPIKQDVADLISDAVYAFDQALESCNVRRDYVECAQWTRHSHHLAKKASFHPSMLPNLYFSTEFTYAVYSPYFLPGYIPIAVAAFKVKSLSSLCDVWTPQRVITLDG